MRVRNIERAMSMYIGCRHIPPAVMLNLTGCRQATQMHPKSMKSYYQPKLSLQKENNTIKIGNKTYAVKLEKISKKGFIEEDVSISDLETMLGDEMKGVLDLRDSMLHSLEGLSMFHAGKPFLSTGDKVAKMESNNVSSSPSYLAFAEEMLSLKDRPKEVGRTKDSQSQTDVMQQEQDWNNLIKDYLQNGEVTLSALNPAFQAYWDSLKPVLDDVKNAQCFQEEAVHPVLRYAQRFTFIADYKGTPSLISIQKIVNRNQQKMHKLKLVACGAALNFDLHWPVQVNNFVLILPKTDGSPPVIHVFTKESSLAVWKDCLMRFERFWKSPRTLMLMEKRLRTGIIPSCNQQNLEFSGVKESCTNNFLTNEEIDDEPKTEDVYNESLKSASTLDAKSEIKEDVQSSTQPDDSNEDSKPVDSSKSLWGFWKTK